METKKSVDVSRDRSDSVGLIENDKFEWFYFRIFREQRGEYYHILLRIEKANMQLGKLKANGVSLIQ